MRDAQKSPLRIDDAHDIASRGCAAILHVARENPGMSGRSPPGALRGNADDWGYRIASRRAIRCSVDGCVEKRFIMLRPLNGLMMNMCAVAGSA